MVQNRLDDQHHPQNHPTSPSQAESSQKADRGGYRGDSHHDPQETHPAILEHLKRHVPSLESTGDAPVLCLTVFLLPQDMAATSHEA